MIETENGKRVTLSDKQKASLQHLARDLERQMHDLTPEEAFTVLDMAIAAAYREAAGEVVYIQ